MGSGHLRPFCPTHRGTEEVAFDEFKDLEACKSKAGFRKIEGTCERRSVMILTTSG